MPEQSTTATNQEPCLGGHKINGVAPADYDQHFHNKVCDCRRVLYSWEPCGCKAKNEYKLVSKANPNY